MLSQRRYFVVDGGRGGEFIALLSRFHTIRRVSNPRHAEVLLVFAPVADRLRPSVSELCGAMPRPRAVIVVPAGNPKPSEANRDLLPTALTAPAETSASDLANFVAGCRLNYEDHPSDRNRQPEPTPLPPKNERDTATELLVLSLGPVQPFTAGPVRILLLCDGEQVSWARVESGFAHRGLAESVQQAQWPDVLELAGSLDPLAPVASRVAFIRGIEKLNHAPEHPTESEGRESAVAWERARNAFGWLHRFAFALAYDWLQVEASALLKALLDEREPTESLARHVEELKCRLQRDRLLRLRTAKIGPIDANRLREAQVDGPVLAGSVSGASDVHARLLSRLRCAATDLNSVAQIGVKLLPSQAVDWPPSAGSAAGQAFGPRGTITAMLASNGKCLTRVDWQRPSARLLVLIPEMLAGQKLADAEIILTSLDISAAEADA